jgi:hypothetical protein
MEQTNNNFPKFYEGQVLTSQALNNYFGYLDEQQRLTRAHLINAGIISGLGFIQEGNTITINSGTAYTRDGYYVQLTKTTYTLAYEYDKTSDVLCKRNPLTEIVDKNFELDLDDVKYVLFKDESDAVKHIHNHKACTKIPDDLDNYIISLVVDFVSQDDITKCSELSCDIVQSNYHIIIRPVLIKRNVASINKYTSNYLYGLKPIHDWYGVKTITEYLNGFGRYLLKCDDTNTFIKKIIETINYRSIKPGIKKLTELTKEKVWNILFPKQSDSIIERIAKLNDHISAIESTIPTLTTIPDYYLKHSFTLLLAFEELFTFYNEILHKHKSFSGPNHNRVIRLGSTNTEGDYRQISRVISDKQLSDDCALLLRHLNRLFSLGECFIYNPDEILKSTRREIKLSRQKPHAKLGEQLIPEYYERNNGIVENWIAHSFLNYSYCLWADGHFDLCHQDDWHDYLVLDEYYGMNISELKDKIRVYNYNHHPINTEYIEATDLETFIKNQYSNFPTNYTVDFNRLSNAFKQSPILKYCTYTNFEKIIEKIKNHQIVDDRGAARSIIGAINELFHNKIYSRMLTEELGGSVDSDLRYCQDYLLHCTYYYKRIIMVGGCPYNGKLVVYHTQDDKIIMIIGTDNTDILHDL